MTPSSELPRPLLVAEGMPAAGKTSMIGALAAAGHRVLGEYPGPHGAPLARDQHPDHRDETPHLANWLTKTDHLRALDRGPVWVDRDWLTALAWGHATDTLPARAAWAWRHLSAGRLLLPCTYLLFDLPPELSLKRRVHDLDPGHPWSRPDVLARLRAFYRDPVAALAPVHRQLAAALAAVPVHRMDATRPRCESVRAAVALAGPTR